MESKSIKISPYVHKQLKKHVAETEENITAFCDKAILGQIKADKLTKKILKSKSPTQ